VVYLACGRFLTEAEPWKMKGADEHRRPAIVRTTLEAVYAFMHFLAPVLPVAADSVFQKLHTPPRSVELLRNDFYNLTPGTQVDVGSILFEKILTASDEVPIQATGTNAKCGASVTKGAVPVVKGNPAVVEDPNQVSFTKMDLRVGPVASGLRAHYSIEDLLNRLVVVVCNLAPSKMKGFASCGMVLAVKSGSVDASVIELLDPPVDAIVGERVHIEGLVGVPLPSNRVKKLKIWEEVVADLRTDRGGVACWQERPLVTSAGPVTSRTLVESSIT
jgi:Putative tRNA binding domain/Anticodon binding domain of methionyl tRNA ligase